MIDARSPEGKNRSQRVHPVTLESCAAAWAAYVGDVFGIQGEFCAKTAKRRAMDGELPMAREKTALILPMRYAHTPLTRLGVPGEIDNAALFLCSPAASWISGQILIVSGGGAQELD